MKNNDGNFCADIILCKNDHAIFIARSFAKTLAWVTVFFRFLLAKRKRGEHKGPNSANRDE